MGMALRGCDTEFSRDCRLRAAPMRVALFGQRRRALPIIAALLLLLSPGAHSLVRLEEGSYTIDGVQLLQDYFDPTAYYYVPTIPRLSQNADKSFQLLCMKYVDPKGKASGGLFHALIDFSLPDDVVADLEKKLKKKAGNATIKGMVPLLPAQNAQGEETAASFQIISAVLSSRGDGGFTRNLIASGRAPLTPGSRAAVAALLTPEGATILFNSLTAGASDVSVGISGQFEASVVGFSARVTADMELMYKHFLDLSHTQVDYTRNQIKTQVDRFRREGILKIESLDRSGSIAGFKANEMNAILESVTNRITEMMFDTKLGFLPEPKAEETQLNIPGRTERGFFAKLFFGAGSRPYFPDYQHVLKKRKDIRSAKFDITLVKNGTVKVPVNTAGNLRLLHESLKDDPRYFRVINLADPSFQLREVMFQVDGGVAASFLDTVNFVSVQLRKKYPDSPDYLDTLTFTADTLKQGQIAKPISYARLGEGNETWLNFEYRVIWSLKGRGTLAEPSSEGWIKSTSGAINLAPPLDRVETTIDADRATWNDRGITAVNVVFDYPLMGKPTQKRTLIRAQDAAGTIESVFYCDPRSKFNVKQIWYFKDGKQVVEEVKNTDNTYYLLAPPREGG